MRIFLILSAVLSLSLNAEAKDTKLKPGKVHEDCIKLMPEQKLHYSFSAKAPLDFNIHYHAGKEVFYPVNEKGKKSADGVFEPKLEQHYCLMWTNMAKAPVVFEYGVRIE